MKVVDAAHSKYVHTRRTRVIAQHVLGLIDGVQTMLDVGCGDGRLAAEIMQRAPHINITGVDVLIRGSTAIPVHQFDGHVLPFADRSFDAIGFFDVLHHADDAEQLLREADRVARKAVIIKDHTKDGMFANATLKFMDQIGNRKHGVTLPYNYWTSELWQQAFDELGWRVESVNRSLGLYPWPASMLFDRRLHFIALLDMNPQERA